MGVLLGFRIGMIFAYFHRLGMLLVVMNKLKMSVRAQTTCGPKCFKCVYEMPSGPEEEVFLVLRMACSVMSEVKGGSMFLSSVSECNLFRITLSSRLCDSLHIVE